MIDMVKTSIFNASGKHRIATGLLIFFVLFAIGLAATGPWWTALLPLAFVILTLEEMYTNRPKEDQ